MARCLRVFHSPVELGSVALRGEAFAYVAVVHRARIGHRIELFDGEGHTAVGTFVRFEADAAHVAITEVVASSLALRPVRLVQCLSKGDKIDETLRDACELGVKHVVVAEAARSVRKLDEAGGAKLRERLSRVAAEAARQALSPHVATVSGPAPLATAFGDGAEPLRLVLDPTGAAPFFDALSAAPARAPLAIAVGPEGGFTASELAFALHSGWTTVRLGTTVLRTETMAAAVLGALRAFDDTDSRDL